MKNWLLRGISRGSEDYTQVLILKFCPDHMTKPEGLHLKICDNTIFLWELIDELCELSKSMVLDLWCTLGSPKELLAEKAVATHSSTLAWKIPRTDPEFAQTHVHWVSDVIQPSNPLSPLLLPSSIFPSIKVFSNEWALFTFFFFFHFYNVVISAIEHLLFKKTCNRKFFPCLFEICLLYSRMCLSWTWEPSLWNVVIRKDTTPISQSLEGRSPSSISITQQTDDLSWQGIRAFLSLSSPSFSGHHSFPILSSTVPLLFSCLLLTLLRVSCFTVSSWLKYFFK